jgi:hypothetical protein
MAKPKVNTNPVANQYSAPNERIIEYSIRSGLGGLISLREIEGGKLQVQLYRHDADVEILVSAHEELTARDYRKDAE